MVHPVFLLPAIVGVIILTAGVLLLDREPTHRSLAEWFVALGPVLFAAPLATFGTEHFVIPKVIASLVPSWLPGRLWITYFVGAALIAASLSFIFRKQARLAALLTAVMLLSFICLIHVPGAATHLRNRDFWIDALRDSTFGVAAFTLFLQLSNDDKWKKRRLLLFPIAQTWVAIVVLAFAVLQLVHPDALRGYRRSNNAFLGAAASGPWLWHRRSPSCLGACNVLQANRARSRRSDRNMDDRAYPASLRNRHIHPAGIATITGRELHLRYHAVRGHHAPYCTGPTALAGSQCNYPSALVSLERSWR